MSDSININIESNIQKIHFKIIKSCEEIGRSPADIDLLAVSKTKSIDEIMLAYQSGQKEFGENYLQESLGKIKALPNDIIWHYIGNIQSKKIKQIVDNFSWIHTLSRFKEVEKLVNYVSEKKKTIGVYIQINIDAESSKSGFLPDGVNQELKESIYLLKNNSYINLCGLMCIPRANVSNKKLAFHRLKILMLELNSIHGLDMSSLSMGMSGDMKEAIEEGSTVVRVGTAIFGRRE